MSTGPGFTATCAALLRGGESVRFRATGRSMSPAIRDGDVLDVTPVEPGAIRPGEVILYHGPRGLLAHRVLAPLADGSLQVRGDAIGSDLEEVAADRILGRVVAVNGKTARARGGPVRLALRLISRLVRKARAAVPLPGSRDGVSRVTGRELPGDTIPGGA